jgi:tetratricopeptide (TPR) repeat protein
LGGVSGPVASPVPLELPLFSFYDTAIAALDMEVVSAAVGDSPVKGPITELARCLIQRRDEATPRREPLMRAELLRAKYRVRRDDAAKTYSEFRPSPPPSDTSEAWAQALLNDNLDRGSSDAIHSFLLRAFIDAHLMLHAVEARLAVPLAQHLEEDDALIADGREGLEHPQLARVRTLLTFVFAAARAVPWAFAQDAPEAEQVRADYREAWDNMAPTFCMWIPTQLSLLALHHRGYAYRLAGHRRAAYKDYAKVQRLARDARRRMHRAPLHVTGGPEFLQAIDALADYHIGEIYRTDHAHTQALKHFKKAFDRFERLSGSDDLDDVLANSRWNIELLLNRGKAAYEMGQIKESLKWHLRSWLGLLTLLAGDGETEVSTRAVGDAIAWLDRVELDPELHKSDAIHWLRPVVRQLSHVTVARHMTALAADILLRLGHLLFVIRLGEPATDGVGVVAAADAEANGVPFDREELLDGMALVCLAKARECDPYSTLVGSDLLKIRWRRRRDGGDPTSKADFLFWEKFHKLPEAAPIDRQAPHGGEEFDQMSRLIEYLLLSDVVAQQESDRGADGGSPERDIRTMARELLVSFFVHTDSISVRKSQVHRYMLTKRHTAFGLEESKLPFLDFICMRRYSSIFPFLPRPSAFRVRGGGYFVRLSVDPPPAPAWSIAVDPGPDFVENLYRAGYALSDVDMVVVTHDHPDHFTSLDPLLSLLHERSELERKEKGGATTDAPLIVLGNESVCDRYAQMALRHKALSFNPGWRLATFSEAVTRTGRGETLPEFPSFLKLTPISTQVEGGPGHNDIGGHAACGLRIDVEAGGSIAFMSDSPGPGERKSAWAEHWHPALTADVLVAHTSSVPLTELRQLAGTCTPDERLQEDNARFLELWGSLKRSSTPLRHRLEYASWLGYTDNGPKWADPIGTVNREWKPFPGHLYLSGTLDCARAYREERARLGRRGLFVVGELSEELGTFRTQVARALNSAVFDEDDGTQARTADIGLKISVDCDHSIAVLCSTCDLDNDMLPAERYHRPGQIVEVCVKGENEGIFYNCKGHAPSLSDDPTFLEQMERYDVFGR